MWLSSTTIVRLYVPRASIVLLWLISIECQRISWLTRVVSLGKASLFRKVYTIAIKSIRPEVELRLALALQEDVIIEVENSILNKICNEELNIVYSNIRVADDSLGINFRELQVDTHVGGLRHAEVLWSVACAVELTSLRTGRSTIDAVKSLKSFLRQVEVLRWRVG